MILSCQAPEIPEVSEVESDIFSDGAEEGEEELPEAGPEWPWSIFVQRVEKVSLKNSL